MTPEEAKIKKDNPRKWAAMQEEAAKKAEREKANSGVTPAKLTPAEVAAEQAKWKKGDEARAAREEARNKAKTPAAATATPADPATPATPATPAAPVVAETPTTNNTLATELLKEIQLETEALTAQRVADINADQRYYKLVDLEKTRGSIKSDVSLYNPETGTHTRKGRRYLDVLDSMTKAQKGGYRFVPTNDGKFGVIGPDGEGVSIDDTPLGAQGYTDLDKGLFSFMRKGTADHKAMSKLMGNVIGNDMYTDDPRLIEAQKAYDINAGLDAKLASLKAQADRIRAASAKAGTPIGDGDGESVIDEIVNKEETPGSSPSIGVLKNPGIGVLKQPEKDFLQVPDLYPDGWAPDNSFLEDLLARQAEGGFEWDEDFDMSYRAAGDALQLGSLFTKGKWGDAAALLGLTFDTMDAAFSEDRDFSAVLTQDTMLALSTVLNVNSPMRKQAGKKLTDLANAPKSGFMQRLGKMFSGVTNSAWAKKMGTGVRSKADGTMFKGMAIGSVLAEIAVQYADIQAKIEKGEKFTQADVLDYLQTAAQIGMIIKSGAVGKKKKTKTKDQKQLEGKAAQKQLDANKQKRLGEGQPDIPPAPAPPAQLPAGPNASLQLPAANGSAPGYIRSNRRGGMIEAEFVKNNLRRFSHGGRLVKKFQNSGEIITGGNDPDDVYASQSAIVSYEPSSSSSPYEGGTDYSRGIGMASPSFTSQTPTSTFQSSLNLTDTYKGKGNTNWEKVKSDYLLNKEGLADFEGLNNIYKLSVDDNWKDVRDNGAEPSGVKIDVWTDMDKDPDAFIADGMLDDYMKTHYRKEWNENNSVKQDSNTERTPFVTSTGLFRGALPYGAITDSIANILSYNNQNTVAWQPGVAPVYTPDMVFAAKSMPFEVSSALKSRVLAGSYDARARTSDPITNQINDRRVHSGERQAMNKIRMDEAQWNRGQIERQENQEIQAQRTFGQWRNKTTAFENQQIQSKLANMNINAQIKTQATQALIDNFAKIAKHGIIEPAMAKSEAVANAEYNQTMREAERLESEYQAILGRDYSGDIGGARMSIDQSRLNEISTRLDEIYQDSTIREAFRQNGVPINWNGRHIAEDYDEGKTSSKGWSTVKKADGT